MRADTRRKLLIIQRLVGLMDTLTGLLLVFAPRQTLALMGIDGAPDPPVFLSWVGVFVFAIGVSYFLVGGSPSSPSSLAEWRMQWKITAIARISVALFVAIRISAGALPPGWFTVAMVDALVGLLQAIGLRAGFWKGGEDA